MSRSVYISVVLAVHNEEHNLGKCLEAVSDWADEIIVVDGESSDKTVEVAKRFDAQIITTTNKSNFHINKQMAMDAAKGKYVLQLDADEVVDDQLSSFIKKLKDEVTSNNPKELLHSTEQGVQPKAWWIKRKNWFLGKWLSKGGQYPDPVIRLYENGYARLPQKDVHEQIQVDGEVATADGHLLHYSNPTFADYLRKFNTYTSFAAHQYEEKKLSINILSGFRFLIWKPAVTFGSLFLRHRGYVDGMAGFVFAIMSGLHHAFAYLKYWELVKSKTVGR